MKRSCSRLLCALCAMMLMGGMCVANAEETYEGVCARALVSMGSNLRLKNALDRAKAGEHITVGIIGGSITEGTGAASYDECYAVRVGRGLAQRCGGEDRVTLLNAGVGGTPSTFGWLRYQRDIVSRVPAEDPDGLPDIVIIEFAVNDWNEPTNHQCYESMVKSALLQPNAPAVILLFAVAQRGWNLQDELQKIGETYDLMMVSIRDGVMPAIGSLWTSAEWFSDEYHPKSLGHQVMADCVLSAVDAAYAAAPSSSDARVDAAPAYGLGYMGLRPIFADGEDLESIQLTRGSFSWDDMGSYANRPLGRVCGRNFSHLASGGNQPLTFTAVFSKLLIGWRNGAGFGAAEVYIDGELADTLRPTAGGWGQTEVSLLLNDAEPAEHHVEIRMARDSLISQFTITCMGIAE